MDKAGSQGLEQLMKVLLARSRQGCQGAAMEAVLERHDGGSLSGGTVSVL